MDISAIRLRFDVSAKTVGYLCIACGQAYPRAFTDHDNLEWLPLDVLLAAVEHECATSAPATVPVPQTPRGDVRPPAEIIRFVKERLVVDPHAAIDLEALCTAYEDFSQTYGMYAGRLSRFLRAALPPGTAIRREMINGVRARRLVGMRLRRQDE